MEVVAEKYQTFGPRIWAGLVDGLVFIPVIPLDIYFSSPSRSRLVLIAWAVFMRSAPWVYSVALHTRYGQTLGKRAARVKVLDVSETRLPSLSQALLRDIGDIVPTAIGLTYFIYFCRYAVLHARRRTVGRMAGEDNRLLGFCLVLARNHYHVYQLQTPRLARSNRRHCRRKRA
jgi:uncharacterized RDD family membrane protein YckC